MRGVDITHRIVHRQLATRAPYRRLCERSVSASVLTCPTPDEAHSRDRTATVATGTINIAGSSSTSQRNSGPVSVKRPQTNDTVIDATAPRTAPTAAPTTVATIVEMPRIAATHPYLDTSRRLADPRSF